MAGRSVVVMVVLVARGSGGGGRRGGLCRGGCRGHGGHGRRRCGRRGAGRHLPLCGGRGGRSGGVGRGRSRRGVRRGQRGCGGEFFGGGGRGSRDERRRVVGDALCRGCLRVSGVGRDLRRRGPRGRVSCVGGVIVRRLRGACGAAGRGGRREEKWTEHESRTRTCHVDLLGFCSADAGGPGALHPGKTPPGAQEASHLSSAEKTAPGSPARGAAGWIRAFAPHLHWPSRGGAGGRGGRRCRGGGRRRRGASGGSRRRGRDRG